MIAGVCMFTRRQNIKWTTGSVFTREREEKRYQNIKQISFGKSQKGKGRKDKAKKEQKADGIRKPSKRNGPERNG